MQGLGRFWPVRYYHNSHHVAVAAKRAPGVRAVARAAAPTPAAAAQDDEGDAATPAPADEAPVEAEAAGLPEGW